MYWRLRKTTIDEFELSWLDMKDFQLTSARDLFPSARNFISARKLAFFVPYIFFPYLPCTLLTLFILKILIQKLI